MESYDEDEGWIQWFCELDTHEFFVEVDLEYIRDPFNMFGLRSKIPRYQQALEMILSPQIPQQEDLQDEQFLGLYQLAADLYGLIHARYLLTIKGLSMVKQKYIEGLFGVCPRVMCGKQHALPIGVSDQLRNSRVKLYCPKCQEVYIPKHKYLDVDGAYFGSSMCSLFFMTYPQLQPSRESPVYIPKLYGFKIYKSKGSRYDADGKKR